LLAGVGALATLSLMAASGLVLGQFDFIGPTLAGEAYLSQPSQIPWNHSSNWRWALYVAYLLVPPSVVLSFWVSFTRRLRTIGTPQLIVGLVCTAQLALFSYLQFFNHVQTLEMHFFSSTLWGVVGLVFAMTIAELSRPLAKKSIGRWVPAALLVAVALGYEAYPHVPAIGWLPVGAVLAAVPVMTAGLLRVARPRSPAHSPKTGGARAGIGIGMAVIAMAGCLLVLTVATSPPHKKLSGIAIAGDPRAYYAEALGGSGATFVDWYEISSEIPAFVGSPTYKSEQLLMWFPAGETGRLIEPIGIFHAGFNSLTVLPVLTRFDRNRIALRRPAELLFYGLSDEGFGTALHALGPYRPVLVRATVFRKGPVALHAWLVVLKKYAHRSVW
jgi:hypothetical protein